jgi:hypothetical protein
MNGKQKCFVFFTEIGAWINRNVDFHVQYHEAQIEIILKVKGVIIFSHTFTLNRDQQAESLAERR